MQLLLFDHTRMQEIMKWYLMALTLQVSRALMDERAFFQNGIPSFSGRLKHLPRVDVW